MDQSGLVNQFAQNNMEHYNRQCNRNHTLWFNSMFMQPQYEYTPLTNHQYQTAMFQQSTYNNATPFSEYYQRINEDGFQNEFEATVVIYNEQSQRYQHSKQTIINGRGPFTYNNDQYRPMSMQYDAIQTIKEEEPNYQHPAISSEPSISQIQANYQTNAINKFEETVVEPGQHPQQLQPTQRPILRIDVVPVLTNGTLIKYDYIQTVLDDEKKLSKKPEKTEKRIRVKYTEEQVMELKEKFSADPYPSNNDFNELAQKWSLRKEQIKYWFQNERRIVKGIGGKTSKPLRSLRKSQNNANKSCCNHVKSSKAQEHPKELKPPAKRFAIEPNIMAPNQEKKYFAHDAATIDDYSMSMDAQSNESNQCSFSWNQGALQTQKSLEEILEELNTDLPLLSEEYSVDDFDDMLDNVFVNHIETMC